MPPVSDRKRTSIEVRLVPKSDSCPTSRYAVYSITSSASNNIGWGMFSPSAFAVLRLMTS